VLIFRPGFVTGNSKTGMWFPTDFLPRLFKSCIQLGMIPDWSSPAHGVDLLPVDYVANTIVQITTSQAQSKNPIIANLSQINTTPLASLLKSFASLYDEKGTPPKVVSHEEWVEALLQAKEGNALMELTHLFSSPSFGFGTAQADGADFKRMVASCARGEKNAEYYSQVTSLDHLLPIYVAWMKEIEQAHHSTFVPMRA